MCVKVTQSCLTLCDPMDCLVCGILQGRILEWVAFPFPRGSSQSRDQTQVSRIVGRFFTNWAIRELQPDTNFQITYSFDGFLNRGSFSIFFFFLFFLECVLFSTVFFLFIYLLIFFIFIFLIFIFTLFYFTMREV